MCCWHSSAPNANPIRRAREALLTFVVIGAGPTGVEMAGALSSIAKQALVGEYRSIGPERARIILLDAATHVLPPFRPISAVTRAPICAASASRSCTDTKVTGVADGIVNTGTERIRAATVIWAAGVQASPLARTLQVPLDRTGRVVITPELNMPSRPEVFVIGDLASLSVDGRPLPGLASVAQQQGDHAAKNIRRAIHAQPLRPFKYRDRGMLATIGRWRAVAEIGDWHFDGVLAWFVWLIVHLLKLVGFRNRASVLLQWMWSLATLDRGVRLITRDDLGYRETPPIAGAQRRVERRQAFRQA